MKQKKLLIVGTGQHARMLVELIEEQGKYYSRFCFKRKKVIKKILGYPILCAEKNLKNFLKKK